MIIQIVHAENFETFFQFLQSLRGTTKASPSQHYPLSLPDNNTHSDMTKHETKTSSTTIGLIALILEIVLILILFLIKLLYKLANNNWKFKVKDMLILNNLFNVISSFQRSWIEIKSMDEYRQRFHKKKGKNYF